MSKLKESMKDYGVTKRSLVYFSFSMFAVALNIGIGEYFLALMIGLFAFSMLLADMTLELKTQFINELNRENELLCNLVKTLSTQATEKSKAGKPQTKK